MRQIQKWAYLVVTALSLVLLLSSPLGAQTTADFDLNGVGAGNVLAGVYTSPYSGSINSGPTVSVICDDFVDDTYVPEDWTAYVTSLSSINLETTDNPLLKWQPPYQGAPPLTQIQAYDAAAILSIDILTTTGVPQEDYSYALWELFDPTDASNQLNNAGDTTDQANAQTYLNAAITDVQSGTINGGSVSSYLSNYNVTIYSYDSSAGAPSCSGGPCPTAPPQEFITVSAAEPPPLAESLVYLVFGAGCLLFFGRRRIFRTDS